MVTAYPTRAILTATDLTTDADAFPILPGADFTVEKSPVWSTNVKVASSGREIRSAMWSAPLYDFTIKHNLIRDRPALPELKKLLGFFNSRKGAFGHFFYLDPFDNASATDEVIGTGDGTTTTFQLTRAVGAGSPYSTAEPVYALWKTPVVKINGTPTAAYTLAPWGLITFNTAPAAGAALTWTGNLLFVCRFADDRVPVSQLVKDLWEQKGIKFVSMKP